MAKVALFFCLALRSFSLTFSEKVSSDVGEGFSKRVQTAWQKAVEKATKEGKDSAQLRSTNTVYYADGSIELFFEVPETSTTTSHDG